MISGVDLSHKNGRINWDLLVKRDVHFVYLRASEALDSADPQFAYNLAQASRRGILAGAYHWLHPRLHVGQQVDLFIRTVGDFRGMLSPVVCLEKHKAPADEMEKNVRSFVRLLEKRVGVRPVIYTSADYWGRNLPDADWGCDYPLWLDHPGEVLPAQVWPWASWTFWQQGYQERLPGVAGSCGINLFIGSQKELKGMVVL